MTDGSTFILLVMANGHRQRLMELGNLKEAADQLEVSMRMPTVTECRLIRKQR